MLLLLLQGRTLYISDLRIGFLRENQEKYMTSQGAVLVFKCGCGGGVGGGSNREERSYSMLKFIF